MDQHFSPKQVARAIGVSEASLKRWCDRGLIPSLKTGGGHRRLPLDGVLAFLRERGYSLVCPEELGLPPPARAVPANLDRAADGFTEALEQGDDALAKRLLFDLYLARHSIAEIGDRVVARAFSTLGEKWTHGDLEIYQERHACEICLRILHELRAAVPAPLPEAPRAIGSSPEGDPYALPTALTEVVLREAGWRAESYGTNNPFDTLCAAVTEVRPRLLWLSVSTIERPAAFLTGMTHLYETATTAGAALVVGGRALTPEIRSSMRYSVYAEDLRRLVAFAQALYAPAPALPRAGAESALNSATVSGDGRPAGSGPGGPGRA